MFVDFLYELRGAGLLVSSHEWRVLLEGLAKGLHGSSLDGFYRLARLTCVKDTSQYDLFDQAFLKYFRNVAFEASALTQELLDWLNNPIQKKLLSDEERALLESLDLERLREMFEERMKEQKERHDGGNRWIGTGGTSPFGHGGTHPSGIRIGGPGGGRSAMQIAHERRFKDYRKDLVLDVRQIDLALRKLRMLGREGAEEELDIEQTVDKTGKNAGDLSLVFKAPRRNQLKLILLMDVGGSMDPYAELVGRLFTAASRAGRFSKFRSYYFHNCVYDEVFEDAQFRNGIKVEDLIANSSRDERLVVVGDALMHPAEILHPGGHIYYYHHNPRAGIDWLKRLSEYYRFSVWLNPEKKRYWPRTTIEVVEQVFSMHELTLNGLEDAVSDLLRRGK